LRFADLPGSVPRSCLRFLRNHATSAVLIHAPPLTRVKAMAAEPSNAYPRRQRLWSTRMPNSTRHRSSLSLLIALTLAAPSSLLAQESQKEPSAEPWRLLLQQQLKASKACDLNEVINFNELDIGDHRALEGRISCIDGREFTFTRPRPHQKFEFNLCEPTVC
jgi:hypothetical protein